MTGVEWFLPLRESRKAEHAVGTIHSTPLVMRPQGVAARQLASMETPLVDHRARASLEEKYSRCAADATWLRGTIVNQI